MLQGLRTAVYHVTDIEKAKAWYSEMLGIQPYFDFPFYVGFNVGGYELGLHPDNTGVTPGGSTFTYWGVPDARAALKRLLELGATLHRDLQDVGEGILLASVLDPWGNIFGVIENRQFKAA